MVFGDLGDGLLLFIGNDPHCKSGWLMIENPNKLDDLGVPSFQETSRFTIIIQRTGGKKRYWPTEDYD